MGEFIVRLTPEKEQALTAEAERLGLSIADYVAELLVNPQNSRPSPRTGAELIDYWQREGLIGPQRELADSAARARALREQSENRTRL